MHPPENATLRVSTNTAHTNFIVYCTHDTYYVGMNTRRAILTAHAPLHVRGHERILQGKSFNLKVSGNEVYYTNAVLSLIKIMLCSQLHCQQVLENSFPIRSQRRRRRAACMPRPSSSSLLLQPEVE